MGLLHFPRKLRAREKRKSKKIFYKSPKVGEYIGRRAAMVGGGDSALDAAVMILERGGDVDMLVRKELRGKAESLARVEHSGGVIHKGVQIDDAAYEGDGIALTLDSGEKMVVDLIVVQIGFLSAKETFTRLDVRLRDDGAIAVDSYYETSRTGIFAVGDVHGDIKLITVAWAEGIQAAIYAFKEITSPYWLNEKRLRDQRIALIGEKLSQAAMEKTQA